MILQVAVSTLNDGIEKLHFQVGVDYLVIHQITNRKNYSSIVSKFPKNVIYKVLSNPGLSVSRNFAIESCTAKYIWFMDDDVTIDNIMIYKLKLFLESTESDFILVGYTQGDKLKKNADKVRGLRSLSSFSSINIIASLDFLRSGLRFDERFGLGTTLPSGEEFIFLTDAYKIGARFTVLNESYSSHPPLTSGQDFFSSECKINAKVEMFKRVFGANLGLFVAFVFFLKKFPVLYRSNAVFFCFWHLFFK